MVLHRTPDVARCPTEGRPLGRVAIAWSRDEFYAACEATASIQRAAREGLPPPVRPRAGEIDLLEAAGVSEAFRGIALWFDERYRAHPPEVALLHLDRFIAIWAFLREHGERLEREGLFTCDERETYLDEDVLTALVGVDYRPGFLDPSGEGRIGRYREVLALARDVRAGRTRIIEFELSPAGLPDGEEDHDWGDEGDPEGAAEAPAFEWDDFLDAMEEWYRLNERMDSALLAEAALFRSLAMDPGDPFESSPALTLLLRWFAERYGPVSGVGGLFLRFMVMAGFIEQHLDRLVGLGFLEPTGERYRLTGSLFNALNNLPLTPSPRGGAEPFDFDAVVAMASACRDLTGDGTIVAMRDTLPPRPRPVAVGRNEPCPCGSGGKFKRCCGPSVN